MAILSSHVPNTTRTVSPLEATRSERPTGPWAIDFLWPEQRLAVETDGARSHERNRQRESDSTRNAWLAAHDYVPLRFTWAQVTERPQEVLAALTARLPADA